MKIIFKPVKIKLVLSFLIFIYGSSLAQKKDSKNMNSNPDKTFSQSHEISEFITANNPCFINLKEKTIAAKMNELKNSDNPDNGNKLTELQSELESISHHTTTENIPENYLNNIKIKSGNINVNSKNNNSSSDNFSLSEIYSGTLVKGIAVQVVQNYAGAGTVWLAVGVGQPDTGISASQDTLIVYKSLDNTGLSFSEFARIGIGSANKFYPEDAIDMEIIELNNITSYIYIVYNYTTNGYNGSQKAGCTIIRDNPALVNNFTLNFPGSSFSGNNYLRPRITSDIGTYPVSPYVTIALTQDSASGVNDHWYLSKYCRIFNPFTTTPSVTYVPGSLYMPVNPHPKDVTFTVQTDLAYINSGSGISNKIVFLVSGYPELAENYYVYKTDATLTGYPFHSQGYSIPSLISDEKEFMRIASNGGAGQTKAAVIFSNNFLNLGDWDEYYMETNISDAADSWSVTNLTFDERISRHGDIVGKRKTNGNFYIAYSDETGCAFRNYSYMSFNTTTAQQNKIVSLNGDYATSLAYPKPAFRYVSNDSSLSYYPTYNKLLARAGNSAPLTLSLHLNIQGLYNNVTDLNNFNNEISVYIASSTAPYNIIDSSVNYFCSNNSSGFYTFNNAPAGFYYLVLKHKNMLETWSAYTYSLTKESPNYADFRYYISKAYGNNLVNVNNSPVRYAMYSGDVNHDGAIDLTDIILIYNDAASFTSGNVASDLTGENIVDLNDVLIAYNNATNFVSVKKP